MRDAEEAICSSIGRTRIAHGAHSGSTRVVGGVGVVLPWTWFALGVDLVWT